MLLMLIYFYTLIQEYYQPQTELNHQQRHSERVLMSQILKIHLINGLSSLLATGNLFYHIKRQLRQIFSPLKQLWQSALKLTELI